ncbi:isocitrate lyase/PEP mutase family protein [Longispora albida]|uniref:isocitrate lyase/PEP mutase family protein n=1 Tax=Longispora albida TaxID=203523 RepID=UPI000360AECB|nr:isocitrate lyase/phosphoenolpyruvate mutase family protein [Longispora albida]
MTNAQLFRSLHHTGSPLALPNAWDVASARIVEDAGAAAVATTSAGVSWSLGTRDGGNLSRDRAIDLIARIAAAVSVPVTADIEAGYADNPAGVAGTIRAVIEAGAAGVNIEDTIAYQQLPIAEQCERLAAARAAAGDELFINARIDNFLLGFGEPENRLAETIERATAFTAAGADGIFVPGVVDTETITALAEAVTVPLNVLAGPGAPDVATLGKLGVARISLGSAVAEAAYAVAQRTAREMLGQGTYTSLGEALTFGEINDLL